MITATLVGDAVHTNNNNELNELSTIIAEYDRRLQEQVTLARQDVLVELEKTIQVSVNGDLLCINLLSSVAWVFVCFLLRITHPTAINKRFRATWEYLHIEASLKLVAFPGQLQISHMCVDVGKWGTLSRTRRNTLDAFVQFHYGFLWAVCVLGGDRSVYFRVHD